MTDRDVTEAGAAGPGPGPNVAVPRGVTAAVDRDLGGDPACWLNRVCDDCGRFLDDPLAEICPSCGAPRDAPR